MADPTKFVPGFDYSDFEQSNPTLPKPGAQLDNDFANLKQTTDQTIDALKQIRRSDGKLKNGIVTADSLSPGLIIGIETPQAWQTATTYSPPDTVFISAGVSQGIYRALVEHISTTFAADLAAGKWEIIFNLSATGLSAVAFSGQYADLSGKPALAAVATSGSYGDLSNKPLTVPTGGVTGQTLTKTSNVSGAYAWQTPAGGGDMLASVYDPQGIDADAFDRANHTGTQAVSTVTGLQTALDAKAATTYVDAQTTVKVNKAGDTMTDTLTLQKLVNAFWAGLKVRNTGNSDAAIQVAAANRDFSSGTHLEFGQRADGRAYIYVAGKQWVMNNSGDMALPNSGTLYGTGDIFCAYSGLNTLLSTILGRMRQVRLSAEAATNVNRSGWNTAPNGGYITGLYKDGAGEIMNYAYRVMQQTDLFGNWVTVPTL
jgi:hypothetical protein